MRVRSIGIRGSIAVMLFLLCNIGFAGIFSYPNIDAYDPATGYYYKSIDSGSEGGGFLSKSSLSYVSNIAIFNPSNNQSSMLFKDGEKRKIVFFNYETGYQDGTILFSNASIAKNNARISQRPLRDKLIIGVGRKDAELVEIWISNKRGGNLRKLTEVPDQSSIHVDVKNSMLRIIESSNGKFRESHFDW